MGRSGELSASTKNLHGNNVSLAVLSVVYRGPFICRQRFSQEVGISNTESLNSVTHIFTRWLSVNTKVKKSPSVTSFRLVCVVPPAVAQPPQIYAVNPAVPYRLEQKSFHHRLLEAASSHRFAPTQHLQFPDLQLMQMDSG